ncbi:MAG: ATP-dependent DNA helicase RecG, partial [Spirochaetales bacterium]
MKVRDIEIPITNIAGVGSALARLFSRVNVFTVADLFSYYPRDWEDRTQIVPLADFATRSKIHTLVQVVSHEWFGFGRMRTLKIIIADNTTQAALVCFNRPFLEKSLVVGSIITVTGSFSVRRGEIQSSAFDAVCISKAGNLCDFAGKPLSDSVVLPVYPLTAGLGQKQVRKTIIRALSEYAKGIEDEIPAHITKKYDFLHKQDAIKAIHNPKTLSQALQARHSLIFEELYHFQRNILTRAFERKKNMPFATTGNISAPEYSDNRLEIFKKSLSPRQKLLHDRLTFSLTDDQID